MVAAVRELAKHGPLRPEATRGLDEDEMAAAGGAGAGAGAGSSGGGAGAAAGGGGGGGHGRFLHYSPDPSGQRTGDAPSPELAEVLNKTCDEAAAVIAKTQVDRNVCLTQSMIQEKLDNIRGAVTMAYPMGLPEYDVIRAIIEDREEITGSAASADHLDPDSAELWWAGKEFLRDQTVGDRVGKNEKTKVTARLQKRGGGAPVREAAISEEERRAMMAFYYKKQEDAKRAAENDEDTYLESAWANPKALKSSLLGTRDIRWG